MWKSKSGEASKRQALEQKLATAAKAQQDDKVGDSGSIEGKNIQGELQKDYRDLGRGRQRSIWPAPNESQFTVQQPGITHTTCRPALLFQSHSRSLDRAYMANQKMHRSLTTKVEYL
ncbi:unnamed protein product [Calypogeia fissa]